MLYLISKTQEKFPKKLARPVTSAEEFKALRNQPEHLANLAKARGGDEEAKRNLLQFNYSGHFPNGKVKGNKLPSNAFGFDIDDPETFNRVSQQLLSDPEKYGLLMLERSVKQGGHAVFRREKGMTILENQIRISQMFKCEMDNSAHDINRVFFATSADADDLLYLSDELFADTYIKEEVEAEARVLESKERFGGEILPPGAHRSNKHYKPWLDEESMNADAAVNVENSVESGEQTPAANEAEELSYLGLPYSLIIQKWWEMYNGGKTPVKSNRDTLTFELAVNLRHIAGYDAVLLNKIIPNYDGFEQSQKMKCIHSALGEKLSQMPQRLKKVLEELRKENTGNVEIVAAVDKAVEDDSLFYARRIPQGAMPQGVIDSVKSMGDAYTMPVLNTVTGLIGFLAEGVKVKIHNHVNCLVQICMNIGKPAAGKGALDDIFNAWTKEVRRSDDEIVALEDAYREKKKAAKNAKVQPEEPRYPKRIVTTNNTLPNIAYRLANNDGKTSISYAPEIDSITGKWSKNLAELSPMLRQAYDGISYEREARSADAVNVHIKEMLWFLIGNGTLDALYRLIPNYTDGLLTRLSIATLPDNTYSPLPDNPPILTDKHKEHIDQIAAVLPHMKGVLDLPKLEEQSRIWLEKVRLYGLKNNDEVYLSLRFREAVNAYRKTVCLMLNLVAVRLIDKYGVEGAIQQLQIDPELTQQMMQRAQTSDMLEAYEVIADSLIETKLSLFRSKMENANDQYAMVTAKHANGRRRGKNDSIYAALPQHFNHKDAQAATHEVTGSINTNKVQMMLRNWVNQGLVIQNEDNSYTKILA